MLSGKIEAWILSLDKVIKIQIQFVQRPKGKDKKKHQNWINSGALPENEILEILNELFA